MLEYFFIYTQLTSAPVIPEEQFREILIIILISYICIYEINSSQNKKEDFSHKKAKIGKKDKES